MGSEPPRVKRIVEDPARFEDIAEKYDDDVACYNDLLDEAKRILPSFDKYLEFYEAAIEYGPTNYVLDDLEKNSVRSLKNMVLRSSRSGKRFPIVSASQLQYRIDSYRELGVDSVTPRTTMYTIIEHILDDDSHEASVYRTLDHLLSDQPTDGAELVTLLARARFVLATETLDIDSPAFDLYFTELHNDLPDPIPENNKTPFELMTESKKKSFADPEKIPLVQASLSRKKDENILQEYLFLSARDIVERYRHQNRADPWRGELQLAVRQFNCLQRLYQGQLEDERLTRTQSYRQLALAELKSGGRWRSLRDPRNLPDSQFLSAGNHYFKAATEIRETNPHRYIKYLSKAFRNQATAVRHRELGRARGWDTSYLIHDQAIKTLTSHIEEFDIDQFEISQDALTETIVGAIATHEFRKYRASAVVAFERRNPEKMSEYINEAWDHLDATPTYETTELLETLRTLSNALSLEVAGKYKKSHSTYAECDSNIVDIDKRTAIVQIKHDIVHQNYESALAITEAAFQENSPLVTAIQIISGDSPTSPRILPPLLKELSAVDPDTKWWFTLLSYLSSKQTHTPEIIQNQIEETLLNL